MSLRRPPHRRTRLLVAALAVGLSAAVAGCSGSDDPPRANATPQATTATSTAPPSASPTPEPVSSPYCDAVVAHRALVAGIGRDGSLTDARLRRTIRAVGEIRAEAPDRIAPAWTSLQRSLTALRRGVASAGMAVEDLAQVGTSTLSAEQRAALRRTVATQAKVPAVRARVEAEVARRCRIDLATA